MNAKNSNKILLVGEKFVQEDNLLPVLRREGFQVTHCPDGWQSMVFLDTDVYKMVILGTVIKSMPNLEVLSLIRSKFKVEDLPILACVSTQDADMVNDEMEMLKEAEISRAEPYPRALVLLKLIKEFSQLMDKKQKSK